MDWVSCWLVGLLGGLCPCEIIGLVVCLDVWVGPPGPAPEPFPDFCYGKSTETRGAGFLALAREFAESAAPLAALTRGRVRGRTGGGACSRESRVAPLSGLTKVMDQSASFRTTDSRVGTPTISTGTSSKTFVNPLRVATSDRGGRAGRVHGGRQPDRHGTRSHRG
jgi:hypothetical protein